MAIDERLKEFMGQMLHLINQPIADLSAIQELSDNKLHDNISGLNADEITALKTISLHDMEFGEVKYSEVNRAHFFEIVDSENPNIKVAISHRSSNNGELRGEKLKEQLNKLKVNNPSMSVHDAILMIANMPENNSLLIYLTNATSSQFAQDENYKLIKDGLKFLAQVAYDERQAGMVYDPANDEHVGKLYDEFINYCQLNMKLEQALLLTQMENADPKHIGELLSFATQVRKNLNDYRDGKQSLQACKKECLELVKDLSASNLMKSKTKNQLMSLGISITNLLIRVFTLGKAHEIHSRKTGQQSFFQEKAEHYKHEKTAREVSADIKERFEHTSKVKR